MRLPFKLLLLQSFVFTISFCNAQTIYYENEDINIKVFVEEIGKDSVLIKYKIKNKTSKSLFFPNFPDRVFQRSLSDSSIVFKFGLDLHGYGNIDLVQIKSDSEYERCTKDILFKSKVKYRRLLFDYMYDGPDIRCMNDSCFVDFQIYSSKKEWVSVYFID
jgi:hypothetical protein